MSLQVLSSAEFRRVRDLPRRPQEWTPENSRLAVDMLSDHFARPGRSRRLRPIQARALAEAGEAGRLIGEMAAGGGKTDLCALLFRVWQARRGLILVPARLREQAIIEYRKLQREWFLPSMRTEAPTAMPDLPGADGIVRVMSYESLSVVSQAGFLEEYDPDVIVPDEAHALARMASARGRRLFRFLREKRRVGGFDAVRFGPLSGSMSRKSIKESAHLYEAALGADRAPVPCHFPDLVQWVNALDVVPDSDRIGPGALLEFCTEDERRIVEAEPVGSNASLAVLRSAYRRRVVETAGVVATSELFSEVKLELRVRQISVPDTVRGHMSRLRTDGVLPSGEVVDSALSLWAHAREVAGGFAYRWDPPAPTPWREAKNAWNKYVADILGQNRPGLDSPLQVARWVALGSDGNVPEYAAWTSIRDTFTPNPVPLWISRFVFEDAEKWALQTGGIVWVQHAGAVYKDGSSVAGVAGADALLDAELGKVFKKIPYFGAGESGLGIRDYKGPCAASIRAHGTGKNLVQWDEALILHVPSSGATMEQLLARLHRPGQKSKKVTYWFYMRAKEDDAAMRTVLADARYKQDISGQPQRILNSRIEGWSEDQDFAVEGDPMWG